MRRTLLAILSIAGGWIGIPAVLTGGADVNVLHHWLEPAMTLPHEGAVHHEAAGVELGLIAAALVIAMFGLGLAYSVYRTPGRAESLARAAGPLHVMLRNLYWVDELYERVVLRPFYLLSRAMHAVQLISASPILESTDYAQEYIKRLFDVVAFMLPDLHRFTRSDWLAWGTGPENFTPIVLQTLIFVTLLGAAAIFDLYRKEL